MDIRNHTRLRGFLAGVTIGIVLGGCAAPTAPTQALTEAPDNTTSPEDRWQASLDGGFDRSEWTRIRFEIPMASVPCNPTYATPAVSDDPTIGRRGETAAFPTIETAMSTETDRGRIRWSAVADPFIAAFDLVASPFRMIGAPPDSTVLEPNGDWTLLPGATAFDETPRGTDAPPTTGDTGSIDAAETAERSRAADPDDGTPTTTENSAGWTISPAFDRPADATNEPRTAE